MVHGDRAFIVTYTWPLIIAAAEQVEGHRPTFQAGMEATALDLTDPTGRAHAAVWFKAQDSTGHTSLWNMAGFQMAKKGHESINITRMCEASNLAHAFEPMTDAQIVDLRDMVLALAEVLHG